MNISDSTLITRAKHAAILKGFNLSGASAQVAKSTYEATIIFKTMNRKQVVVSYNGTNGRYEVFG